MSKKRKTQRHKGLSNGKTQRRSHSKRTTTAVDYLLPFGKPDGDTFQSMINPEYLLARPGAGEMRPTLASQLCQVLITAQNLFGERDHSYTFLGFEFVNGAPRLLRQHDGKYLIIQLYLNAMHNPIQAYSQIAHEGVHMLSPRHDGRVSVMEEGLAYFFSNWYILQYFGVMPPQSELKSYDIALELVDKLMSKDAHGIKKMRQEEPTISLFTKELVLKYYPAISERTAEKLVAPFDKG
ncbi:MAG: hypothetical protein AAFU54_21505 [Chloroflexota bacterium]